MENNDQKKTVELTTLPNTEVFGLLNCMVKPGSIVDNIENKTRKFEITSFYDDIAMVGVIINPIYKLNDNNEIKNILCKYSDLNVKYINRHDVNSKEILLDYTLSNPELSSNDRIQYYYKERYGDSSVVINKNLLTIEQPETVLATILNTINNSDLGGSNHLQLGNSISFRDSVISTKILPSYLDIYLNDKYACTVLNTLTFTRRMRDISGIASGCLLEYNSLDVSDLLNSKTPLNVKIAGSTNVFKPYKKIITVIVNDDRGSVLQGEFTKITYRCGDVSSEMSGMEMGNIQRISSDNDDDIIELEFFTDNPTILSKYKYVSTPIVRFNVTNDTNPYPEIGTQSNNPNSFYYNIIFDIDVTDTSIKCRIPNKFIKNVNHIPWSDSTVMLFGLITADGTFTTEKPNTP